MVQISQASALYVGDNLATEAYLGDTLVWNYVPPMPRLTKTNAGMIQRNGVNFRTGGINAFQIITNDYPTQRLMSHANIDSLLTKALALNVKVIRGHTLAASVENAYCLVLGTQGDGTAVTLEYDNEVWDRIDYAIYRARRLGIYLIAPFVDELGYYHGGKRQWVQFRHPGSVSLDYAIKASNSSAQRQAENVFYTDAQIQLDFKKFISDWLNHLNPYTNTLYKDEPVLSVVQPGNELWTAAQDAPTWIPMIAAYIKSISPTTLVMDSGSDGLAVETMAWESPNIDILETHPYTEFTAENVRQQSVFAASKGKAFAVGEYAWSKATAPAIEQVVLNQGNIFFSACWSLQNDEDLHNNGVGYGGDDASLYVPGKDATQQAANTRLRNLHDSMAASAATATPPVVPVQGTDNFNGTTGDVWSSDFWRIDIPRAASDQPPFGNAVTVQSGWGRMHTAALGGYNGNAYAVVSSRYPKIANQRTAFNLRAVDRFKEAYFRVALRSSVFGAQVARSTCYFSQFGASADGTMYVNIGKMVNGVETFFAGGGVAVPGWANGSVPIQFEVIGSVIKLISAGTTLRTATDTQITAAGYFGFDLRGGNAAVSVDWEIDNWILSSPST